MTKKDLERENKHLTRVRGTENVLIKVRVNIRVESTVDPVE